MSQQAYHTWQSPLHIVLDKNNCITRLTLTYPHHLQNGLCNFIKIPNCEDRIILPKSDFLEVSVLRFQPWRLSTKWRWQWWRWPWGCSNHLLLLHITPRLSSLRYQFFSYLMIVWIYSDSAQPANYPAPHGVSECHVSVFHWRLTCLSVGSKLVSLLPVTLMAWPEDWAQ